MRSKRGIDFTFEKEIEGTIYKIAIKGYKPGRPAPNCSNPDSPAYSDPGDDPEFDDYKVFDESGNEITAITDIDIVDRWIDRNYDVIDNEAGAYIESEEDYFS